MYVDSLAMSMRASQFAFTWVRKGGFMRNVKKQTYQVLNLSLPKPSWENALQMLRFSSDVKLHGTIFFLAYSFRLTQLRAFNALKISLIYVHGKQRCKGDFDGKRAKRSR